MTLYDQVVLQWSKLMFYFKEEINIFIEWCDRNKVCLIPWAKRIIPKLQKLKKRSSMKSLGILVFNTITWKNHTVLMVCKIKQHLLKETQIQKIVIIPNPIKIFYYLIICSVMPLSFGEGSLNKKTKTDLIK